MLHMLKGGEDMWHAYRAKAMAGVCRNKEEIPLTEAL